MKFRHICLLVRDIDKSVKWYEENFNCTLMIKKTISGQYPEELLGILNPTLTYAKLTCHGTTLELIEFMNPKQKPRLSKAHIAFTIDNLENTYNKLLENGVGFISPPIKAPDSDCTVCFCVDPNGNLIELVEE